MDRIPYNDPLWKSSLYPSPEHQQQNKFTVAARPIWIQWRIIRGGLYIPSDPAATTC